MSADRFSFRHRLRSFTFAWRGVRLIMSSQHNAWIHAAFTIGVIIAGIFAPLQRWEWCAIILAMMAVWTAEALNTALEFLCDFASPEIHPLIGKAKDAAAAGVLFSAIGSVAIGIVVFAPHLLQLL